MIHKMWPALSFMTEQLQLKYATFLTYIGLLQVMNKQGKTKIKRFPFLIHTTSWKFRIKLEFAAAHFTSCIVLSFFFAK